MVFVPLHDENPLRVIRLQLMTAAIIFVNALVFIIFGGVSGAEAVLAADVGYGVVPAELLNLNRTAPAAFNPVAEPITLITYMFFHAGWLHLLSNMTFLWVFGDNVEDAFGHFGFLLFYLLCGIAGALAHVAMYPASQDPLVGASGALSGVIASYFLLYPRAKILVLAYVVPIRLPAFIVLGGWIALQVLSLRSTNPEVQGVAWWAHIGGFAAGFILTALLRSRLLVRG
jgi:membrane associated rhomboid family serine protease